MPLSKKLIGIKHTSPKVCNDTPYKINYSGKV
jgi:hypothetical protein